jgi:hypothetical protein
MDARRRTFLAILLVFAGFAAGWVFLYPSIRRSRAADVQVTDDANTLTQFLGYEFQVEPHVEDPAWLKRKPLYDEEMLASLRRKLEAFVEFEAAEYADAKQIYLGGTLPDRRSQLAQDAEKRLREQFGPRISDAMAEQFRLSVREKAYQASPKVGGGADPDLPRYDELYDDLVRNWLPRARARIEELTRP